MFLGLAHCTSQPSHFPRLVTVSSVDSVTIYLRITHRAVFPALTSFQNLLLSYLAAYLSSPQTPLVQTEFTCLKYCFDLLSSKDIIICYWLHHPRNLEVIHDSSPSFSLIPIHSLTEFCWLYLLNIFWISPFPRIAILTSALLGSTSLLSHRFFCLQFHLPEILRIRIARWVCLACSLKIFMDSHCQLDKVALFLLGH